MEQRVAQPAAVNGMFGLPAPQFPAFLQRAISVYGAAQPPWAAAVPEDVAEKLRFEALPLVEQRIAQPAAVIGPFELPAPQFPAFLQMAISVYGAAQSPGAAAFPEDFAAISDDSVLCLM